MPRRSLICLAAFLVACGATSSGGTSSGSSGGASSSGASSGSGTTASSKSGLQQSSSSVAAGSSSGSTRSGSASQSSGISGSTSSGGLSSTSAAIPDNAGCVLADGGAAVYCSARCTDTSSDLQSCGACGVVCPSGKCVGGSCVLASCVGLTGGSECELGDGGHDAGPDAGHGTCCNGSCFAPSQFDSDADNCGSCGFGCVTGATCKSAACTLPGTTSQGLCGSCTGGTCTKGLCSKTGLHCGTCPTGEVCIDTDPNYGGICVGDTCTKKADGVICELGTSANPDPGICCTATCVDENTDSANCGACGAVCAAGLVCFQGSCLGGGCRPGALGAICTLDAGQLGICCGGSSCVDTTADLANCGSCGELCPTAATSCKSGSCLLLDGGSATCALPASGCPSGAVCDAFPGSLSGPLTMGFACASTTCAADGDPCYLNPSTLGVCCSGSCVNTAQDPANCGGCGLACPSGICVAGAAGIPQLDSIASDCLPPSPSMSSDCSASGGCPAGWSCIDDLCLPPYCTSGGLCAVDGGNPGVCCQIAGQGYCVDIANDANNCGSCGNYCPFGQACVHGVCSGTQAPCSGGNVNDCCDLSVGPLNLCCPGGGCVNTLTDAANCGGCGYACGDGGTCAAGVCG